uniref:SecA family profile domain-containing protein n=1 Tax=Vitrella brassicaformis TaxID=1169539 RepID=A0A7S1KFS0_9ALVE
MPTQDDLVLAARGAFEQIKETFQTALENEQEEVRRLGGLYVIGTQRHESRRIDNQLRGRSGRQGDLGASRFFLSVEDDIFRIFGGDKLSGLMSTFKIGDDIPIESNQVTESLNNVQRAAEEYFRDIRKRVFEFDRPMVSQRQEIYGLRRRVLKADDGEVLDIATQFANTAVELTVEEFTSADGQVNGPAILEKLQKVFGESFSTESVRRDGGVTELVADLKAASKASVTARKDQLEQIRPGLFANAFVSCALARFDRHWAEHLQRLGYLKESINVRLLSASAGRRQDSVVTPIQQYEIGANQLFQSLLRDIQRLSHFSLSVNTMERLQQLAPRRGSGPGEAAQPPSVPSQPSAPVAA